MSRWRPGATPRAKGCLLLWSWRTSPFHAKVSTSVASEWIKGCVFVTMLNTEMFWRNRGVRVIYCKCCLVFFRLLFGCGHCLRDGPYAIYFVPFHVFVSSCSVPMLYVGLRVFISLYWFPVGWAEFLTPFPAVVDRQTFGPQAPETRQCLEERCVTAGHNCLICHWVFWVFVFCFVFFKSVILWFSTCGQWGQDLSVWTSS